MSINEKEIIRLCQRKNAKAQKILYDKYYRILMGICMRYAKSIDEAEDTLQTGMLRIFKKINTYEGKGSFEGWMKRIMVNIAIDNFRKSNKYYFHENIDEINGQPFVAAEIPSELNSRDLLKIVQKLPDGYRVVFNMFAIEGFSHREIADKLGISENTSKTQLKKARNSLKKMLYKMNYVYEEHNIVIEK